MREYDDPYKILANNLVVDYTPMELSRITRDREFTRKIIERELRQVDFFGTFLDCLMVDIHSRDKWIFLDMMNSLSDSLMNEIDTERLAEEIQRVCDEFNIELPLED